MADLTYTNDATERRDTSGLVAGHGLSYNVKVLTSTIELGVSADADTVKVGRLPSNARICMNSSVYWDDLATSGSPTMDIGVASVDANITSDPDALNNGLDVTSAGSGNLLADAANAGLPLWDFVNGQSSDPGGELDIYLSIVDAATTQAGTVTVEVLYYLD